jgi:hypothetical protein
VCVSGCPCTYIHDVTTGLCIRLDTTPLSRTDAIASCQADGGHLLTVDSDATMDHIKSLILGNAGKSYTIVDDVISITKLRFGTGVGVLICI